MTTADTRLVSVGTGTWQSTPRQQSQREIDRLAEYYGARLADVYAAQIRLYRALLATDLAAAESAALDLTHAVNSLPQMPAWPDTDEELIARLKGKFAPLPPAHPETSKRLTTAWDREHADAA